MNKKENINLENSNQISKDNDLVICSDLVKQTKDLIKHRYVALNVDHVWTLDFTHIVTTKGFSVWFLSAMDLASRRIISHEVKKGNEQGKCTWTANDVIKFLEGTQQMYQTKPQMIHTDQGGQFVAKEFIEYLENYQIKHSLGDQVAVKNSNQTHERFHRTLKFIIKTLIPHYLPKNIQVKTSTLKTLKKVNDWQKIQELINEAVNFYNEKDHKHLQGNSPNLIEHVLLLDSTQRGENTPQLAKNNTPKASEITEIKQVVLNKYAGDWLEFFIQWRAQNQQDTKNIINTIKQETELQATRTIKALSEENLKLGEQVEQMKNQVEVLNRIELDKQAQLKFKEERKLARKNRNRLADRDTATGPELHAAIEIAKSSSTNSFIVSRDIVCLILLYCYGLRASNLLLFNVRHIYQLLNNDFITIPLIKTNGEHVTYAITSSLRSIINTHKEHFLALISEKENSPENLIITRQNELNTISRVSLTTRLNNILTKTGKLFNKNLKSHSFRIGFITSIIECSSIDEAKLLVRHSNISTTNIYNRRNLSEAKVKAILSKTDSLRELKTPKKYKLRVNKNKKDK